MAHNQEIAGSNPAPATKKMNHIDIKTNIIRKGVYKDLNYALFLSDGVNSFYLNKEYFLKYYKPIKIICQLKIHHINPKN